MVEMSQEYAQTLEDDRRERAMEQEMGIIKRIPADYKLSVVTYETGKPEIIQARRISYWLQSVLEGAVLFGIFFVGFLFWIVT